MKRNLPSGVDLHDGESVVAALYPWWLATAVFYVFTLGLWELWRRRHFVALTTERVLYGKGIVFSKALRSLPIKWVQDATYRRIVWMGGIEVSSAGGSSGSIRDAVYRPREAKEFAKLVSAARRDASRGEAPDAHPDARSTTA